jgi:hypothetical protein
VSARQKRLEQRLSKSELDILWKAIAALADEANKMLAEQRGISHESKRED